ncbi:hypothetical protein [Phaeovulum sp.]|uniref:hypothetical protein n=1 Tax=Phaeovulum sp. TaxID=2934796 RepID=UPI0039E2B7F7
MTALSEYQRLESPGLWREQPEAQRREVIVSFGDATLVISDDRSARALAHWSLPAVTRRNPGERPALYAPGTEPGEELELTDDTMINAIEKVHTIIESRRPHPGRLRGALLGGSALLVIALMVFWLPGALITHASSVAPSAKRIEIGRAALAELATVTGNACASPAGNKALEKLAGRLHLEAIFVLPEALKGARQLPGRIAVLGRNLIENNDSADVAVGHILAAEPSTPAEDPLLKVLRWAGLRASFRLLTTGNLPQDSLRGYGVDLLSVRPSRPAEDVLLARFEQAGVSATPYAYAVDPSGETVLGLIEADPFKGAPSPHPPLDDADWVALQAICDG